MAVDAGWKRTVARALSAGDAGVLPLHFRAAVLLRYLERSENSVLRSDSVGRLIQPGKAAVDFGIVDDDQIIHLRFGDLLTLVPESERPHWLEHLLAPAVSRSLIQMQLTPGACHDDGPLRRWTPDAANPDE